MPKLSVKPPSKDSFLNEPEKKKRLHSKSLDEYPWEDSELNERVIKSFSVRLNEIIHKQIDWIVTNSSEYKSKHAFFEKAVLEKIEQELSK